MALISCPECKEPLSTEVANCPHCGAPQRSPVPPRLRVPSPPAAQQKEEIVYSDNVVEVTTSRITVCGTTYALRNITSVKMAATPPRIGGAILLLIVGIFILLAIFVRLNEDDKAPIGVYVMAGAMISGAILWLFSAKTHFHIGLLTSSGEIQVVTSKDGPYIERVVRSINEAIAKCR